MQKMMSFMRRPGASHRKLGKMNFVGVGPWLMSADIVKVDVGANPGISQAFGIQSIPTIAFFKPGRKPLGVLGFRPMAQLEQVFGLADLVAAV
jgi:hypothetical protein